MTDYTPTTEEVRQTFAYVQAGLDHDDGYPFVMDIPVANFDRWLAEMKAEAVNAYIAEQEMKAKTIETVGNMINRYKTPANNVRSHI